MPNKMDYMHVAFVVELPGKAQGLSLVCTSSMLLE